MSLRIFQGGHALQMRKDKAGQRIQPATISTDQLDGHRTIILPTAFEEDKAIYDSNGTLLWAHDQMTPPIGTMLPGSYKIKSKVVLADFVEAATEFASQIFDLYEQSVLKGFSVGGYIRKYIGNWCEDADCLAGIPKHARDAMKSGDCWMTVTRFEQRETSGCACPSNPGALSRAVADGLLSERFVPAVTRGAEFVDLAADLAMLSQRQDAMLYKLDRICEALCRKDAEAPVQLVAESQAEDVFALLKDVAERRTSVAYTPDNLKADLAKLLANGQ